MAYNVEGFLTRIATISDPALKLVNIAFQLGIPPRECRFAVVAYNGHVANTEVRKGLTNLEATLKLLRTRNSITHHKRYSDEELDQIELYHVLDKGSTGEKDPMIERYRAL